MSKANQLDACLDSAKKLRIVSRHLRHQRKELLMDSILYADGSYSYLALCSGLDIWLSGPPCSAGVGDLYGGRHQKSPLGEWFFLGSRAGQGNRHRVLP